MGDNQNNDIELGQTNGVSPAATAQTKTSYSTLIKSIWSKVISYITVSGSQGSTKCPKSSSKNRIPGNIESRPKGYPRFGALIASHDHFYLCRRFSELRARTLLLKQDKLSRLEKQLQDIDKNEIEPLYLATCRDDKSSEREVVLLQIDKALSDYDEFIIRNRQILDLEAARPQAVSSLRNWIAGNACIARKETAYLSHSGDLLSVASTDDTIMIWMARFTEAMLIRLRPSLGLDQKFGVSSDPKVHIMPQASIARAARVLMTPFIVTLLLAPVIVCNCVESLTARLIIIVTAASMFIAVLSGSTRAKTTELVVAGATYTTVLIVFITSTSVTLQEQGLGAQATVAGQRQAAVGLVLKSVTSM